MFSEHGLTSSDADNGRSCRYTRGTPFNTVCSFVEGLAIHGTSTDGVREANQPPEVNSSKGFIPSHEPPRKASREIFTSSGVVRPPYNPELYKYWRRRHELFSRFDRGIRLDAESWFSATPELVAVHTAKRLMIPHAPCLMLDGFGGAGGNAVHYAGQNLGGLVICIELDSTKAFMARHNARLYGVDGRIDFVIGDFTLLARCLRGDVLSLDPPWSCISANAAGSKVGLAEIQPCGAFSLLTISASCAPARVLKLPKVISHYDLVKLCQRLPNLSFEVQYVVRRKKGKPKRVMILVFIHQLRRSESRIDHSVHMETSGRSLQLADDFELSSCQ
eukprot:5348752-Pleurochrysis_carterae.AAC.10